MDHPDFHPNWRSLAAANLKWKIFVHAAEESVEEEEKRDKKRDKPLICPSLEGDRVQQFYRDLLESGSSQGNTQTSNDVGQFEYGQKCDCRRIKYGNKYDSKSKYNDQPRNENKIIEYEHKNCGQSRNEGKKIDCRQNHYSQTRNDGGPKKRARSYSKQTEKGSRQIEYSRKCGSKSTGTGDNSRNEKNTESNLDDNQSQRLSNLQGDFYNQGTCTSFDRIGDTRIEVEHSEIADARREVENSNQEATYIEGEIERQRTSLRYGGKYSRLAVTKFAQTSRKAKNQCTKTNKEDKKVKTIIQCPRTVNQAARFAQYNDADGLRGLLHSGLDVNTKDEYGWSMLMIASCAGATNAVRTLLEYRPRTGTRDSKGNTALYLATKNGHKHIVEMLIASKKGVDDSDNKLNEERLVRTEEFVCDVCKMTVWEATEKQHKASIAHQFNQGISKQKTIYGIPPSNRGYQLLVNQGWDAEKGLGPTNQGTKFPIKTVLKRDREGLGSEQKSTARVTHFGPADTSAVVRIGKPGERRERAKTLTKRELKRQKTKEQQREIELRRELNGPDY